MHLFNSSYFEGPGKSTGGTDEVNEAEFHLFLTNPPSANMSYTKAILNVIR